VEERTTKKAVGKKPYRSFIFLRFSTTSKKGPQMLLAARFAY